MLTNAASKIAEVWSQSNRMETSKWYFTIGLREWVKIMWNKIWQKNRKISNAIINYLNQKNKQRAKINTNQSTTNFSETKEQGKWKFSPDEGNSWRTQFMYMAHQNGENNTTTR